MDIEMTPRDTARNKSGSEVNPDSEKAYTNVESS